jgi:hypothetical protein
VHLARGAVGSSVLRLFDKVPGEVELTPNPSGQQRFGLFFIVLPDRPAASAAPPEPSPAGPPPQSPSQQPPASAEPPAAPPLLGKCRV